MPNVVDIDPLQRSRRQVTLNPRSLSVMLQPCVRGDNTAASHASMKEQNEQGQGLVDRHLYRLYQLQTH